MTHFILLNMVHKRANGYIWILKQNIGVLYDRFLLPIINISYTLCKSRICAYVDGHGVQVSYILCFINIVLAHWFHDSHLLHTTDSFEAFKPQSYDRMTRKLEKCSTLCKQTSCSIIKKWKSTSQLIEVMLYIRTYWVQL